MADRSAWPTIVTYVGATGRTLTFNIKTSSGTAYDLTGLNVVLRAKLNGTAKIVSNVFTYPDDYSNAAWTKTGSIAQGTSASGVNPDGGDMQEWHASAAGDSISISRRVGSFEQKQCLSVYIKANNATSSALSMYDPVLSSEHHLAINWTAGVASAGTATRLDDYGVEDIGNGVYRAWIYVDGESRYIVGHARYAFIYPRVTTSDTTGIYLWRAQLDVDAEEPLDRAPACSVATPSNGIVTYLPTGDQLDTAGLLNAMIRTYTSAGLINYAEPFNIEIREEV